MFDLSSLGRHPDAESLVRSLFPDASSVVFASGDKGGVGGGMASSSERATVTTAGGKEVRLFFKVCRAGSNARKYQEALDTFGKDVAFFRDVLPALEEEAAKGNGGESPVKGILPRFFGAGMVGEGDGDIYVVLEDFSKQGFKVVSAGDFLEADVAESCLRGLARLHSLGVGRGDLLERLSGEGQVLLDRYPNSNLLAPLYCDPLEKDCHLMEALLDHRDRLAGRIRVPQGVKKEDLVRLRKHHKRGLNMLSKLRNPSSGDARTAVLLHGDFHMWNVAANQDGKVIMFDYQAVTRGRPCSDVQQFLSQSVTSADRRAHLRRWLSAYAEEMNRCRPELKLTVEELQREYERLSPIGLWFAARFMLWRFVDKEDEESFEAAKKAAEEGDSEKAAQLLSQCGEGAFRGLRVVLEAVGEYCRMGALDVMDELFRD